MNKLKKLCKNFRKLGPKKFFSQWKEGVKGITPKQQTVTQLWSQVPIFGGILWGMTVTAISGTWWLTLILTGALPLNAMTFVSNLQKYWRLKKVEELRKEAEND